MNSSKDLNEYRWIMIDELKNKIAATEGVDFAPFGEGISDKWIRKAEERLNFTFPGTYK